MAEQPELPREDREFLSDAPDAVCTQGVTGARSAVTQPAAAAAAAAAACRRCRPLARLTSQTRPRPRPCPSWRRWPPTTLPSLCRAAWRSGRIMFCSPKQACTRAPPGGSPRRSRGRRGSRCRRGSRRSGARRRCPWGRRRRGRPRRAPPSQTTAGRSLYMGRRAQDRGAMAGRALASGKGLAWGASREGVLRQQVSCTPAAGMGASPFAARGRRPPRLACRRGAASTLLWRTWMPASWRGSGRR